MNTAGTASVPIGSGGAVSSSPGRGPAARIAGHGDGARRVVLTWVSTGRGGAERSVAELAAGLAACGLSTTVLWWDTDGGGHPRPGPGVAVLPVTTLAGYTAALSRLVAERPTRTVVLSSHRTALVDLTVLAAVAGVRAGAGARLGQRVDAGSSTVPVVPVLRALLLDGQALRVIDPASGALVAVDPGRWPWPLLAGAACWTAVSTAAARSLAQYLPTDAPIRVIHNGVGPGHGGPAAGASAEALRRPRGRLRCAAVARATAWKRVDALVEAFAVLPPGVARLDVYGGGPDLDRLRRLVTGRDIPVLLHGHVADLPARLVAADLLVSASRSEAFGRGVAEAAAAGVPAVVPAGGASSELVLHDLTGWIYDSSDPQSLPVLLTRLAAADPAVLTAAGTAARARAAGLFTPARCAAQYLDLCHTLTTAAGTTTAGTAAATAATEPRWAAT
jgi:glycosyltransferase involved in cell wall biosynthesis